MDFQSQSIKSPIPDASIKVSDILETNVSDNEKREGYDIADYLLQFSVSDFHAAKKRIENIEKPYQTIGEIFDMLKKTYKHMPPEIQINAYKWKAN